MVWNEQAVLLTMALVCMVFGTFGDQVVAEVIHYEGYFPIYKQLVKIISYCITYVLAYGLYKVAIENRRWTKHIMGIELGYNSISLSIVSFFFLTALYLNWVV